MARQKQVEHQPEDYQLERAVLGSILLDNERMPEVLAGGLGVIHFANNINKIIYAAMVDLYKSGLAIDQLALKGNLQASGNYDRVGPLVLQMLDIDAPDPGNVMAYVEGIKQDAFRQSIYDAGQKMMATANNPDRSTEDMMRVMSSGMRHAAAMADTGRQLVRVGDSVDDLVLALEDGLPPGIKTGYSGLDTMLTGLKDGGFYVIAGRPGMGKTALALNISRHVASNEKKNVVIISLEMTQDELAMRFLSDDTGISSEKLQLGLLTDEDWEEVARSRRRLAGLSIRIEDSGEMTLEDLSTKLRKISLSGGIDLVIVDYLQLMSGNSNAPRHEVVSAMSRGLKMLAKELSVPIVCMSQLNREVEKRPDPRPQLSDLRESGSIEQDANAVVFVYRPEYYRAMRNPHQFQPGQVESAELILAKNRNGRVGVAKVLWDAERMRFLNPQIRVSRPVDEDSTADSLPSASFSSVPESTESTEQTEYERYVPIDEDLPF